MLKSKDTIIRLKPVTKPAARPANPPKIVPPITNRMAKTMEPNAPATVAFHNPPKIPSCTHNPTISPAMNNPRLTPQ